VRHASFSEVSDPDANRSEGRKGNLLTRLLPGRGKDEAPRKTLPLSEGSSESAFDDADR
jgi:hypothetical protein